MKDFHDFLNIEQIFKIQTLPLLTILLIAFISILVWKRTKSTHPIMSRLWRIFNGKNSSSDSEINEILDTRTALMQFRFTTGIPIRLRTQIKSLILWGKQNEEDLDDIARCGHFFDLEKPELRKIPKSTRIVSGFFTLLILCICTYVTIFSIFMASTDRALLKIIASDNLVLLGKDSAKKISFFNTDSFFSLSKKNCSTSIDELEKLTKLTKNDIILICKSINNETELEIIENSVTLQKIVFTPVSLFLCLLIASLYRLLSNMASSKKMEDRLKKRELLTNSPDFSI
ncbi:DUF6216 family protein [Janthinobacterium lividum]